MSKAKELWESFNSKDRVDFVERKFKEYRERGYEVSHFRSLSAIYDGNKKVTVNRNSYHEMQTIIDMDNYLNQNKDE